MRIAEVLKCRKDAYKANLKRRADNKPASKFEWDDALKADGIPILARRKATETDPNIIVTHDIFSQIMQDKSSYIASRIELTYGDEIPEDVRAKYEDLEKRTHLKTLFKEFMESCTGWGNTYALCSLDNSYNPIIEEVYSWNAVKDEETGRGYVIDVIDKKAKKVLVYEYDDLMCYTYESSFALTKFQLINKQRHGFGKMPLIEFKNNKSSRGNAEKAVYLIDAYDRITADNLTEWGALRQAYLLLKDVGNFDKEDKKILKQLAVILGRNEHSDARFVTKNLNPDYAKFITEHTHSSIWSTASCPDPKVLENLTHVTAFQISQLYRRLDNNCKDTLNEWQKSLQQLDEVLHSFWTGLDLKPVADYNTWEIDYAFHKDIPIDVMTYLKDLKQAGGNLPQAEIFVKSGYEQTRADELVKAFKEEQTENSDTHKVQTKGKNNGR